jgi:hypothetical protein
MLPSIEPEIGSPSQCAWRDQGRIGGILHIILLPSTPTMHTKFGYFLNEVFARSFSSKTASQSISDHCIGQILKRRTALTMMRRQTVIAGIWGKLRNPNVELHLEDIENKKSCQALECRDHNHMRSILASPSA